MSAVATRLSPAANLLRNSRLFSVPAPIPPPTPPVSSQGYFDSESATSAFPTHAAIQTYPASLQKGDWGVKRSLPTRSTAKGAKTAIRIRGGIDTNEHVTDFESAGDHVVTLQKWQSLHLPILKPPERVDTGTMWVSKGPQTSVFEEENDNIAKTDDDKQLRWRFDGPYLQGISGLEFDRFLGDVRAKKDQFRKYLQTRLQKRHIRAAEERAQSEGHRSNEPVVPTITDAEIQEEIKVLRKRPEAFRDVLSDFLDLPGGPVVGGSSESPRTRLGSVQQRTHIVQAQQLASEQYARSGPPRTHPSGGLSYLRSASYMTNHAAWGPTPHRPPVLTRVMNLDAAVNRSTYGVSGFVATPLDQPNSSNSSSWQRQPKDDESDDARIFATTYNQEGGQKTFTQIVGAAFGSNGKLELGLRNPSAIALGTFQSEDLVKQKKASASNKDIHQMVQDRAASSQSRKSFGNDTMPSMDRQYQPANVPKSANFQSVNAVMQGRDV
ncbi:MAG: hypothetical protein Q9227_002840 [Pyrenula ochraceoflavens]